MACKRLEDIEVWQRGCRLAVQVYRLSSEGGFVNDWGLRDQIRRSAVSIPSNIAEGFERDSDAEFNRFSKIAKGSCGELRTQLYISQAIGYLKKETADILIDECLQVSAMIAGLSRYLKESLK